MKKIWSLTHRGQTTSFDSPIVMGILNATPDSFYNQGEQSQIHALLSTAESMLNEGATILDIGGMSTRPGAEEIDPQTEWARIMPIISLLKKTYPNTILSVDTYRADVAEKAIEAGVDIINDISGGTFDNRILSVAAQHRTPFICMHTLNKPRIMQQDPVYTHVVNELISYFKERINTLTQAGIHDIVLDPGFGFGKNTSHNYQLLNNLSQFKLLNRPVLVGISRKSMIYKPLQITPNEALNGTTALHMHALMQGADILRVHDVREAMQCIQLHRLLNTSN